MKRIWEAIKTNGKKVLMWLGAIFAAIFTVLFIGECRNRRKNLILLFMMIQRK